MVELGAAGDKVAAAILRSWDYFKTSGYHVRKVLCLQRTYSPLILGIQTFINEVIQYFFLVVVNHYKLRRQVKLNLVKEVGYDHIVEPF